jgi:hypothetical protein
MKNEIIVYSPKPTKPLSEASISKCYGTIIQDNKCYIAKPNYDEEIFKAYCPLVKSSPDRNSLTVGNSYFKEDSLNGILIKLVEHDYQIYEFEDTKELFKWMIE